MNVNESDVKAMRQQRDLKEFMLQTDRAAAAECARRRQLVNRYPDLVEQLHEIPGQLAWNGYIAPDTFAGKHNDSPIRARIVAIVEEAERRAA